MRRYIESVCKVAVISSILSVPALAGGTYLPHHYLTHSPPTIRQDSSSLPWSSHFKKNWSTKDATTTLMVSRSQTVKKKKSRNQERDEESAHPNSESSDLSYNDLGPIGKTVAGCTEILFATAFDFCSGYLQGLVIGTLFGSPGFIFRPITKGVRQPFMTEVSSRFSRMNARSMSWGKNFGSISAAFGGFAVAVKVLRNGEKDAWTDIFSSAAAGAFFARKDGPQAMLRGALLYGGLIYFTSGRRNNEIQEYTENTATEF